ncbi:MFS transporter [Microbacterium sp. AISO3]|jgi:MFS family permease|uniref:MFS transporter n=1 Tax=Microbacterium arborescens TaxID=33883 RepID=A0ABX2WF67_9MICO|nr:MULTISPECIES: MFS transporter [Microbacterium]APF33815.1 MFS transporter [Microbacterium paludicola]OAZ39076.1 MFS transporter [Microbacterium arborescens]OWP21088.1 MFS transporter [Microbacterium sp. AISO3]POX67505.1 MFS transporter [Microbacterium sp. Ru50]QCR39840.1 MFS transporter [Microbacterium sp. SGAir0570]
MRLRRDHLIDLRPLTTSPAFARMWVGSTLAGLGGQLTIVAIMLHMYDLTASTFAVAMIAVAGLVPMIIAGLYGGMLADAFDRRRVALIAASVTFASTAVLMVLTWSGGETVAWLYAIAVVNSAANSVVMAARQAIVPRLIPRELLPAASALGGITMGIMVSVGPAAAGLLVAFTGYGWTYTIDLVLMSALFLGLWSLPSIRPEGAVVRPGLRSLADGWRFIKRAKNIRLQFILDIIAMTFGQPTALFPAIGAVLLGGGAITTGLLTAAIAVGAFFSSLFSGPIARYPMHGRGIERAIIAYGITIALFGGVLLAGSLGVLSPGNVGEDSANVALIALAAIALAGSGAADNVSSIYRNTMVQAAVPDAIRGRLQGLFIVVVAGGPRLGALYAGTLATVTALWFPPLLGGFIIVGLVALLVRLAPAFRSYDAAHPTP